MWTKSEEKKSQEGLAPCPDTPLNKILAALLIKTRVQAQRELFRKESIGFHPTV